VVGVSAYIIVFRIVHIVSAIAWGGSVLLFVTQIQPTAAATAPASGPFMRELLGTRRLVDRILGLATSTIVGGLFLYWHDYHAYGGFGNFVSSAVGAGFTIGAVSAIVAYLIGIVGTRPGANRLLALMDSIGRAAQSGSPPPPETVAELQRTQATLRLLARLNLVFIGIAALAMSTARYW
jgi:hypothetical protein